MSAELRQQITKLRKRRGIVRSSITRLERKLHEIEELSEQPTTQTDRARELSTKVEALDTEFKKYHFEIIDLIDENEVEAFEKEQEILDEHDDIVADMKICLKRLISSSTPDPTKLSVRRLNHLEKTIDSFRETIWKLPDDDVDVSLIEQFEVQVISHRAELSEVQTALLSIDDQSSVRTELEVRSRLEDVLFECSLRLRKLLRTHRESGQIHVDGNSSITHPETGVRLPKLSVPTFDGDLLNWRRFWDQFCISVHNRPNLSKSEKLVYLQHALKDGPAKAIIEGLSQSGEQYDEAVECLTTRFDRPRLLHQAHVKMILDAPTVRDGTGKELRKLHDVAQQHLRALKSLGEEPSPAFITSIIELKLDPTTMFEWQRHTQSQAEVPHYKEILEFIDYRAQASEVVSTPLRRQHKEFNAARKSFNVQPKPVSYTTNTEAMGSACPICQSEKHPIYSCSRFRSLPPERRVAVVKENNLCTNCLGRGHFTAQCKSLHRCKRCQNFHHTLLHIDQSRDQKGQLSSKVQSNTTNTEVSANATTTALKSNSLLMTCQVLLQTPNEGESIKVRALLDSGSSASFVSERVVQSLRLPRTKQCVSVSGIGGSFHGMKIQSAASFKLSPIGGNSRSINVSALVIPRVTCELPTSMIPFNKKWKHLQNLELADPKFNTPGRIDVLLGIDIFTEVLCHGRRRGPSGTPVAMETLFGWVLCGTINSSRSEDSTVTSCHTSVEMNDDLFYKFWKIEEPPSQPFTNYSQKERIAVQHFKDSHSRSQDGRFIVHLPRSSNNVVIGESRSQAVRRFLSLERSLSSKGQFQNFDAVIREYFELNHAELIPYNELEKDVDKVFYLPMHAVYKNTSTTTKIRAVFDASARSSSGASLNDILLKGPTVHSPLMDVLLRFRLYRVAITADVSKMYRAIELAPDDKDLHRFVWRSSSTAPLLDYRMNRVTFGVCASSFVAGMAVRQNALENEQEFPLASKVVEESVYVDDCLTGANDIDGAIYLHRQLLEMFNRGGFLLRKWNSSEPSVLQRIDQSLRDSIEVLNISGSEEFAKTLGLEWNTTSDHCRISIASIPSQKILTKRMLVSNVSKIFDVLGWLSPTVIKMKILLQSLWEAHLNWDDEVPQSIKDVWLRWESEMSLLSECFIPRYYFPKDVTIIETELHGFSDASEDAYAAVIYLRGKDANSNFHTGLVLAKTRVSPLKRLSIPRLELCGAHLLANLLEYVKSIYRIPIVKVYAWTDSTIVLNWLIGSPRRFKTFVGNRISAISDAIPPKCWRHVSSQDNPADCASRGIYPTELLDHQIWWKGPKWLTTPEDEWPRQPNLIPNTTVMEEAELCLTSTYQILETIIPLDRYSSFTRYQRVTAWILRFIANCRSHARSNPRIMSPYLLTAELRQAEVYWLTVSQTDHFSNELAALTTSHDVPLNSALKWLNPFIDTDGLLRVGGRITNSKLSYSNVHPIILHGQHTISKLLILREHHRLLHAGPSLLNSSISLRYHIIGLRRISRSITRGCVTCRRTAGKSLSQLQGQLPPERVNPDSVFNKIGLDYAGPFNIKYGYVRKPTIVKAYVALFVSLTVKAVHLELVSDLTTQAFIAALRRFIGRRGHPSLIWSDHGTNFVGANTEIKQLYQFVNNQRTSKEIAEFCASRQIEWKFIPERSPHFGGLWEAAVKSMKTHLKRIISTDVRLTYEEMCTVLCQIEACLNSRPLASLHHSDDEVVSVLTPGHFIVGGPLVALPDNSSTGQSISLLRRWQLCQNIVHHFWSRWSREYIMSLNKYTKWPHRSRNASIGDVVILRDETLFPTKWPLARIIDVHPGEDNLVRVVTIKTDRGIYKRPITKIVVLIPADQVQPDDINNLKT